MWPAAGWKRQRRRRSQRRWLEQCRQTLPVHSEVMKFSLILDGDQFVLRAKALSTHHTPAFNNLHQSGASSCHQPAELETKECDWFALKAAEQKHRPIPSVLFWKGNPFPKHFYGLLLWWIFFFVKWFNTFGKHPSCMSGVLIPSMWPSVCSANFEYQ